MIYLMNFVGIIDQFHTCRFLCILFKGTGNIHVRRFFSTRHKVFFLPMKKILSGVKNDFCYFSVNEKRMALLYTVSASGEVIHEVSKVAVLTSKAGIPIDVIYSNSDCRRAVFSILSNEAS